MKLIGLIGGLGPASTVHYYRAMVAEAARRGVKLGLAINHADVERVLALAAADQRTELGVYLLELLVNCPPP